MDTDFINAIQKMIKDQGKEILVNGKAQKYLADYCGGQFQKETKIFRQILDAKCGEHINSATDVLERKRQLAARLEADNGFSQNVTADYLDLLGLILKGDASKTAKPPEQSKPAPMPQRSVPPVQPQRSVPPKPPAQDDDPYMLGERYYYGRGVSRDCVKAVEWYRKAAEQGHAGAQYMLGWCYENGDGVSQDNVKRVEWYRKAAEQGHARAQFALGRHYFYGSGGVPQDYTKAAQWYRKAADQGETDAKELLDILKNMGKI